MFLRVHTYTQWDGDADIAVVDVQKMFKLAYGKQGEAAKGKMLHKIKVQVHT